MKKGGRCRYCDVPLTRGTSTRDHVLPRVHGGEGGRNIVSCCRPCNVEKADMHLATWLRVIMDELHRPDLPTHRRLLLQERRARVNSMRVEFSNVFWPADNLVVNR